MKMNRELKFRVYNPDEHKMMYFTMDNIWFADRYLQQHKYPVQQYTGLKDYTGKEIYEGDILSLRMNIDNLKSYYSDYPNTILPLILENIKDGAFVGEVRFDGNEDILSQFSYIVGDIICFSALFAIAKEIEIIADQNVGWLVDL